jgi:hypothetical protein
MFAAVIRDVDERGIELHQRIQMIVNGTDGFSLERRKDLKRNEGVFGLIDVVYDFHPEMSVMSCKSK